MATIAAPSPHPFSTSQTRAPYTTSTAPNMADTLPTLDFKFDDLRKCMSDFTRRFDAFIEQGRRRVLDERNSFRMRVAEMQDQEVSTTRAIEHLSTQTIEHSSAIDSQNAETAEMQSSISSLTETRDKHLALVNTLKARLHATKSSISTRKAALETQRSYLAHQASQNGPELEFWERCLGLRIEGTGQEDHVRFVFEGLDERKRDREAWFELDLSGTRWEVSGCRPRLEGDEVERCLGFLRSGEDLKAFLGGMRKLFVAELRH